MKKLTKKRFIDDINGYDPFTDEEQNEMIEDQEYAKKWKMLAKDLKFRVEFLSLEDLLFRTQRGYEVMERLKNEIRNAINYYGKDVPDPIKHHIKQCLRIQTGKRDVDDEYQKILEEETNDIK